VMIRPIFFSGLPCPASTPFRGGTVMGFSKNAFSPGRRLAGIIAMCVLLCLATISGLAQSGTKLEIRTLSSRPDLVSGGDALVEVRMPAGIPLNQLTLTLNGKDVTNQLKQTENDSQSGSNSASSSFSGLISGMVVGNNTLLATIKPAGKSGRAMQASLAIKNYPVTGPILSGPHMKPYECRTVESGLGPALDSNCSAAQKFEYFYRASNNTFKPFDPNAARPSDLVNTTTNEGKTVPYIIRVESGTINR